MKKRLMVFTIVLLFASLVFSGDLLTVAEQTNYKKTATYSEVINYLKILKTRNPEKMKIYYFATSTEGKKIPLVILSDDSVFKPQEIRAIKKYPVLIMANIHAGEIEGKEATLILMREILEGKMGYLLKNQTILFIPIFNPDGNDKIAKGHRGDNGPEEAGVRYNGQGYDLNRDYIKLETPEVRGLIGEVFNKWDPILFVDMHTTDGSYHQEPVTYAPNNAPQGDNVLTDFMWKEALPKISNILMKKYKIMSIPYGNFKDRKEPTKGWVNHAYLARYGTCYYGLRNRFSILDENYAHADYKTRVIGALSFIKSILEYTNENMDKLVKLVSDADKRAVNQIKNSEFGVDFKTVKTYDFIIHSYIFKVRKMSPDELKRYPRWLKGVMVERTDKLKNYKLPLFASYEAIKKVKLTEGYILLPSEKKAADVLKAHGICVQKIKEDFKDKVIVFHLKNFKSSQRLFQGHHLNTIEGEERVETVKIPKGSYYVSLSQPLSRLIAYMLEPESKDGFAAWNFFDKILIREWSGKFWKYPVYKTVKTPNVYMIVY
jgi:hypothetical protein